MILRTYKIKSEYTKKGKLKKDGSRNSDVAYHRYKTIHDIKCDVCQSEFSEAMDAGRLERSKKHMCPECRKSNKMHVIYSQYRKEKENINDIGKKRIHKGSKYPEIYVGIESWHTKHQSNWCREHIYVMEESLGHTIPEGFVVHHIDGDKNNNNPENLVMLTVQEHNNAHAKSELLIFELVKKGSVVFNPITKLYEFSNK